MNTLQFIEELRNEPERYFWTDGKTAGSEQPGNRVQLGSHGSALIRFEQSENGPAIIQQTVRRDSELVTLAPKPFSNGTEEYDAIMLLIGQITDYLADYQHIVVESEQYAAVIEQTDAIMAAYAS